jgi:hypothetical protein
MIADFIANPFIGLKYSLKLYTFAYFALALTTILATNYKDLHELISVNLYN